MDHLIRLVDELLDVARITAGDRDLKKDRLEFASIISHTVELCEPLIHEKEQQLDLDIAFDSEGFYLTGDLQRLTQAVGNILNNATKYTQRGGEMHLSLRALERLVEIVIADNGMGMEAAVLPQKNKAAGFDYHLVKPADINEIEKILMAIA